MCLLTQTLNNSCLDSMEVATGGAGGSGKYISEGGAVLIKFGRVVHIKFCKDLNYEHCITLLSFKAWIYQVFLFFSSFFLSSFFFNLKVCNLKVLFLGRSETKHLTLSVFSIISISFFLIS